MDVFPVWSGHKYATISGFSGSFHHKQQVKSDVISQQQE